MDEQLAAKLLSAPGLTPEGKAHIEAALAESRQAAPPSDSPGSSPGQNRPTDTTSFDPKVLEELVEKKLNERLAAHATPPTNGVGQPPSQSIAKPGLSLENITNGSYDINENWDEVKAALATGKLRKSVQQNTRDFHKKYRPELKAAIQKHLDRIRNDARDAQARASALLGYLRELALESGDLKLAVNCVRWSANITLDGARSELDRVENLFKIVGVDLPGEGTLPSTKVESDTKTGED